MITIKIRWKSPICWIRGHKWEKLLVIHPAWNKSGWTCKCCSKYSKKNPNG